MGVVRLLHRTVNIQDGTGFAIYQRCRLDRSADVVRPIRVMTAWSVSVEASRINSLYVSDIVKTSGKSQESSPDRHLELLLPCADGREVWQFARSNIHFIDDSMHLVKNIEEPSIWEVNVFAETVNPNDYPVSVAAVTLLDRW